MSGCAQVPLTRLAVCGVGSESWVCMYLGDARCRLSGGLFFWANHGCGLWSTSAGKEVVRRQLAESEAWLKDWLGKTRDPKPSEIPWGWVAPASLK